MIREISEFERERIFQIVDNCESIQISDVCRYTKDMEKQFAYDEIVEVLGLKKVRDDQ